MGAWVWLSHIVEAEGTAGFNLEGKTRRFGAMMVRSGMLLLFSQILKEDHLQERRLHEVHDAMAGVVGSGGALVHHEVNRRQVLHHTPRVPDDRLPGPVLDDIQVVKCGGEVFHLAGLFCPRGKILKHRAEFSEPGHVLPKFCEDGFHGGAAVDPEACPQCAALRATCREHVANDTANGVNVGGGGLKDRRDHDAIVQYCTPWTVFGGPK